MNDRDMPEPSTADAVWFKSSFSAGGGCVEIAMMRDGVAVRDSKDRGGPVLNFTHDEWSAFVAGVKVDEFQR